MQAVVVYLSGHPDLCVATLNARQPDQLPKIYVVEQILILYIQTELFGLWFVTQHKFDQIQYCSNHLEASAPMTRNDLASRWFGEYLARDLEIILSAAQLQLSTEKFVDGCNGPTNGKVANLQSPFTALWRVSKTKRLEQEIIYVLDVPHR